MGLAFLVYVAILARFAPDTGATEVRGIFAHPDDHQAVKDEAAKINRRRARSVKKAAP